MDKKEIKALFQKYDTNCDGTIDMQEYVTGCRVNNQSFTDEELKNAFVLFDTNNDNELDEMEFFAAFCFLGLTKKYNSLERPDVRQEFKSFDIDGDGKISIDEYIIGCRQNGSNANEELIRKAFRLFDIDEDGSIDEQEYFWSIGYLTSVNF